MFCSSPIGAFLGLYTVYTIKILRSCLVYYFKHRISIFNQYYTYFHITKPQYSKKNKNLHLKFYLFLTIQPMKNVFYYWSDKTKEDNKIIDLLHREVKFDIFFIIIIINAMGNVLKFLAKIGN